MQQQAVYELATVAPHLPEGARFDAATLRIFTEGYMHALQMALKVMQLAEVRWQLYVRTRRLDARRRREQDA